MAEQTFEAFVEKERTRLSKARNDIIAKRTELDEQLAAIDKEMSAIEAYEMVKQGRAPATTRPRKTGERTGTRRTGIREEVLAAVTKAGPDGIAPADIRAALGIEGKAGAQSVANALSALKRASKISDKNGSYIAA